MFRFEIFTTLIIVKNRINAVISKIIDVLGKYIDEIIIECEVEGMFVMLIIWIFDLRNKVVIINKEYAVAKISVLLEII